MVLWVFHRDASVPHSLVIRRENHRDLNRSHVGRRENHRDQMPARCRGSHVNCFHRESLASPNGRHGPFQNRHAPLAYLSPSGHARRYPDVRQTDDRHRIGPDWGPNGALMRTRKR